MQRRPLLFILSALSLLIALAVAGVTTAFFVRAVFPGVTHPIAEFDGGDETRVALPSDSTDYRLVISVPDRRTEVPEYPISMTTIEGTPIEFERNRGWMDMLGRSYRYFADVKTEADEILITVDADPTEDFSIYQNPGDVLSRQSAAATPGWLVSFGLLVTSVVLCFVAIFLHVPEPSIGE